MLPYDSFLIDGPWLTSIGWALGKITRRFVPDEAKRRKANNALGFTTLAIFYITSISLYFNLEWTRWIWEMCKGGFGARLDDQLGRLQVRPRKRYPQGTRHRGSPLRHLSPVAEGRLRAGGKTRGHALRGAGISVLRDIIELPHANR